MQKAAPNAKSVGYWNSVNSWWDLDRREHGISAAIGDTSRLEVVGLRVLEVVPRGRDLVREPRDRSLFHSPKATMLPF